MNISCNKRHCHPSKCEGKSSYCFKRNSFVEKFLLEKDIEDRVGKLSIEEVHYLSNSYFWGGVANIVKGQTRFAGQFDFNKDLEQVLFRRDSVGFIQEVKHSQSFMDSQRLELYNSMIPQDNLDLKAWNCLASMESEFWQAVDKSCVEYMSYFNNLDMPDYLVMLSDIGIYVKKIYNSGICSEASKWPTISVLIELLASKVSLKKGNGVVGEGLNTKGKMQSERVFQLEKLINLLTSWFCFKTGVLDLYSFESTCLIEEIDGVLYLKQKSEDYHRWKLVNSRYSLNKNYYLSLVPGDYDQNFSGNIQCNAENYIYKSDDDDYKAFEIWLEDLNIKNELCCGEIDFGKLADNLRIFIKGYCCQQEKSLEKVDANDNNAWLGCFAHEFAEGKSFNRFNVIFDITQTPLLKIGDKYFFLPNLLHAEVLYLLMNIVLTNDCSNVPFKVEEALSQHFREVGFETKVIRGNNKSGDVDLIVRDKEKNVLLVQVKTTKIRQSLKEIFFEEKHSEAKGFKQLDIYEYDSEHANVVARWLASTSYENCLKRHNGIVKVNIYDLIRILKENRRAGKEWENLKEFVNYIENEEELYAFANHFNIKDDLKFGVEIGLNSESLKLGAEICGFDFDSILSSIGEVSEQDYPEYCDVRVQLEKPEKYIIPIYAEKSRKLDERLTYSVEEMCNKYPNTATYWLSLSEIYKEKIESEDDCRKVCEYYDKALTLLPDDAYVLFRYILFCSTHGGYFNNQNLLGKAKELNKRYKELYWFINPFYKQINS